MNLDQYILVDGPSEDKLLAAVQELADLYADSGFTLGIKVYKSLNRPNLFLLNFAAAPDFERFKYFVNYLAYPEVADYKAKVMGFTTLPEAVEIPIQHIGKRILLYVPEHAVEGDNVHGIIQGEEHTVKMGFAFGEEYQVQHYKELDFAEPQLKKTDFTEIQVIQPNVRPVPKKGAGCALFLSLVFLLTFGLLFGF